MSRSIELEAHEYMDVYEPNHPLSAACQRLIGTVRSLDVMFTRHQDDLAAERLVADAAWALARSNTPELCLGPGPQHADMAQLRRPDAYGAPPVKHPHYVRTMEEVRRLNAAEEVFPGMMTVALVSALDGFEAELMRAAFKLRPELLKSSERELIWRDLHDLASIDEVRGLVVEREVEALLHRSHSEQIETLQKRLQTARIDLDEQADLLELCERRHLYAHRGGRVSTRYIKSSFQDLGEAPQVGSFLETEQKYYHHACETVITAGVKLTQSVWRATGRAQTLEEADRDLAYLTYALLVQNEWTLAQRLLEFATNLPRYSSLRQRLVFVVNLAQSYKWAGDEARCRSTLDAIDWTATDSGLRLSVAVLCDDFDAAGELMLQAGQVQQVLRSAFDHWPVYRRFRQSDQFGRAYQALFGQAYRPDEVQRNDGDGS